jgi:hypothetical protein
MVSVPYSDLLITDGNGGRVPDKIAGLFASTESCIAVGCKPEADGETEVNVGDRSEIPNTNQPSFEGVMATPNKSLTVSTVEGTLIIERSVANATTTVSIWLNHPTEPDRIVIALD